MIIAPWTGMIQSAQPFGHYPTRAGQPDAGGSGCHAARGRASPGALRPRLPLPVVGVARAHRTVRADALHEREGLQTGQRGRGRLLRTDEGRGRLPREVGGTTPRRGARPDRRVPPLVQPRAHQTITRLYEPGTIQTKPRNGCMIISKKMSAAPTPICMMSRTWFHLLVSNRGFSF